MATMLLDKLMTETDPTEALLVEYRQLHRMCAECSGHPDDPEYAQRFARLAGDLGRAQSVASGPRSSPAIHYDATQVRKDHVEFVAMVRAESQFSEEKLKKFEEDLKPKMRASLLYSHSGRQPFKLGFSKTKDYVCDADRALDSLRRELKGAATSADDHRIRARMKEVQTRSAKLAAAQAAAEDPVIRQLNARQRIATMRVRNRRPFPVTGDTPA